MITRTIGALIALLVSAGCAGQLPATSQAGSVAPGPIQLLYTHVGQERLTDRSTLLLALGGVYSSFRDVNGQDVGAADIAGFIRRCRTSPMIVIHADDAGGVVSAKMLAIAMAEVEKACATAGTTTARVAVIFEFFPGDNSPRPPDPPATAPGQ